MKLTKKIQIGKLPHYTSVRLEENNRYFGYKEVSVKTTVGIYEIDLTNYLPSASEYPNLLVQFQCQVSPDTNINDWSDTRVWVDNVVDEITVVRVNKYSESNFNAFWLPIDSSRKIKHKVNNGNCYKSAISILGWIPIELTKLQEI